MKTKTTAPGSLPRMVVPLPMGTETEWGVIGAVGCKGGERFYLMCNKAGTVAMMPADIVERHNDQAQAQPPTATPERKGDNQ